MTLEERRAFLRARVAYWDERAVLLKSSHDGAGEDIARTWAAITRRVLRRLE